MKNILRIFKAARTAGLPGDASDTGINPRTHAPTDRSQSLVRLGITGFVVLLATYIVLRNPAGPDFVSPVFLLAITYFITSIIILLWSIRLHRPGHARERLIKRVIVTFTDLGAIAAFMIVAGTGGAILYPAFLSTIIGNGIRYGTRFLYLSMGIALLAFAAVVQLEPFWRENLPLSAGLLVALVVVPFYALRLLNYLDTTLTELKRSHEARSRFIANMSHELRTPLHTILSLSDLLYQRTAERRGSQEETDMLQMIATSGEHLLSLVNQVLDVARLDAGGIAYRPQPFDLYQALRHVNDIIAGQAEVKGLSYHLHVAADVPHAVIGSRDYLSQILINLLGNAIKFTDTGHVALSVTSVRTAGDTVELDFRVVDTGIGMSAEVQARIFEAFSQGDESINRRFGGTGLGLTISRQFAELLGGKLECSSRERIGTQFVLRLPLTLDSAQPRLQHVTVPALYLKQERRDEGEFVRFAAGGWKIETHTVDSAIDLLVRRSAPELHAIFIDASAFAGKETHIASFVRMRVVLGLPLILVRHGHGEPVDTELFLTRIDYDADPLTLRQVAHLVESLQKAREVSRERSDQGAACRILIADDNTTNQRTARLVLESAGHRVTVVNDGEQALDALERDGYDLAFMDMHMPNMSGIDAAKLYQFIQPVQPTPIVILTADATDDARNLAESARVAAYMTKPIRADDLLESVKKYARQGAPRHQAPDIKALEADPKVVPLADALVDPTELRQLLALCGNPDEIAQLIEEFIADTRVQLRRANEFYETQQWSSARDLMHAMKGASRTVGAIAIAKRVSQLEKAPIEELRERGQLDIAELRGIVDRTRTALRETIARNQDNRRALADPRKGA